MNKVELHSFREELEKRAFAGKIFRKIFPLKKPKTFVERMGTAGKSLVGAGLITGGIGVGGLAYGAVTQPGSIRSKNPSIFRN